MNKKFFFTGIRIFINFLSFMVFYNLILRKKYLNERNDFINFMEKELKYSDDWFTNNIHIWCHIFEKENLKDKKLNILEIGSYEGISAVFFLRYLKESQIDCVETFQGSDEHLQKDFDKVFSNFNFNLEKFDKRYKIHKTLSNTYFNKLKNDNKDSPKKFDIIYIDGSHEYEDVLNDAHNSFEFLNENGIIIFDDFLRSYYSDINKNPIKAIIEFLKTYKYQISIKLINYQLIIKKNSK
tara:strand:- start:32 stop:748 length:717 start_codon:yes stop_codon:yes gene_type:complete